MKSDNGPAPKVLLVGDFMWPWYHEACANALEHHGCVVKRFGWFHAFRYFAEGQSEPIYHSFFHRIQYRFGLGPVVRRISRELIDVAAEFQPDIVWFYNVHLISPRVVIKLREICSNSVFVQYANDNPFSKSAKQGVWRKYLASISYFDLHCVFRHSNIKDYREMGSKNQALLRAYFIPEVEYQEPTAIIPDRFKCDVVFAGHFEDDGRAEMLEAVCNAGFKLNIFGGGWTAALNQLSINSPLRALYPIAPATGADYRYAICGAKVALCFLSKLNQDTYTRRNFQIPAMRVAMLSEYTDDLAALFQPNKEALYFENERELIYQLNFLIGNDADRQKIANAGFDRVYTDGHDVKSRMKNLLKDVYKLMPNKSF
jgi:spore maturation protein CgeB